MRTDPDDDALSWDGDVRDPTHVDADAVADASAGDPADAAQEQDLLAPGSGSSAALVGYGILAGIYLLFVIGWIIASQRDPFTTSTLVFAVLYQFGEFLAIAAPVLWFGLVFLLTPGRRASVRLGWLLAGLPLIAPWPYFLSLATRSVGAA